MSNHSRICLREHGCVRRRDGHGFTLVELLVTIAIIALLVSILLPSLNQAKILAREAVCAVNVRNLCLAATQYAAENNQWFPEVAHDLESGYSLPRLCVCYWMVGHYRDVLRDDYGVCRRGLYSPSNPGWNRDTFYVYPDGSNDRCVMGYFFFGGYDEMNEPWFRNRMTAPPDVSDNTPLFARRLGDRSHYDFLWADLNRQYPISGEDTWVKSSGVYGANHLNGSKRNWPRGSHMGYLDGHVEWIDGEGVILQALSDAELYW